MLEQTQRELELCQTFQQEDLKTDEDIVAVYISGICVINEESILLADYWNGSVKLLKQSTKKVVVLFEETSKDWGVSNMLGFFVGNREFLAITEWCHVVGGNDRVVITDLDIPKKVQLYNFLKLNERARVCLV